MPYPSIRTPGEIEAMTLLDPVAKRVLRELVERISDLEDAPAPSGGAQFAFGTFARSGAASTGAQIVTFDPDFTPSVVLFFAWPETGNSSLGAGRLLPAPSNLCINRHVEQANAIYLDVTGGETFHRADVSALGSGSFTLDWVEADFAPTNMGVFWVAMA